jgi:uncharacterized protein (TIGR02646 family)
MIKLNRPPEPAILTANKDQWTSELIKAVKKYGSYKDIPEAERDALIAHYRHKDIKEALEKSSLEKCAFCESKPGESGNVEVEHFAPKSIHCELTFEWVNLLPCCRKCNGSKGTHDTVRIPIVNPYIDDPSQFFFFVDVSMRAKAGPNFKVAQETIKVCGLDGIRLMKPRASVLLAARILLSDLDEAVREMNAVKQAAARLRRIRKIAEAIDRLENVMNPAEVHSSFIRSVVEKEQAYSDAKLLVQMAGL